MPDSKRQRIVAAAVERMKLINGTGDYVTDLNDQVADSRTNWQQDELPAVSVFDMNAEATMTSAGGQKGAVHAMGLSFRAFVVRGSDASAVRQLLADIQTAIRQDETWTDGSGPIAMQTRQIGDSIIRMPESFEIDGGTVDTEVQFITKKFDAVT
jgi:hypothetical protein